MDDQRALDIAKKETQFSKDKGDYVFDVPKKYIWVSKDKKPAYHASWLLELHVHIKEVNTGKRPVNHWKVFVDAQTGEVLEKFDLARDLVSGGFEIKDGIMRTLNAPGLGVQMLS